MRTHSADGARLRKLPLLYRP